MAPGGFQATAISSVLAEMDVGERFENIALANDGNEKKARNTQNGRKARDTVVGFLPMRLEVCVEIVQMLEGSQSEIVDNR